MLSQVCLLLLYSGSFLLAGRRQDGTGNSRTWLFKGFDAACNENNTG